MKPIGMSGARIPNWVTVRGDEIAELARQLPERIVDAVAELLGQDDVLEPLPGVRACRRRAGRGTVRHATGARGRRATTVSDQGPGTRRDQPAAPPDPGIDGEHVQPDRDRQQERQRVVADGQPEDDRRRDRGSGHPDRPGRARRRPSRPLEHAWCGPPGARTRSSQATSSHSMIATNARWSVCVSACVAIAQAIGVSARPIPAAIPIAMLPVSRPDQVDGDRGRDCRRRSPRAGSSGTPAHRTAGGRPRRSSPTRT